MSNAAVHLQNAMRGEFQKDFGINIPEGICLCMSNNGTMVIKGEAPTEFKRHPLLMKSSELVSTGLEALILKEIGVFPKCNGNFIRG